MRLICCALLSFGFLSECASAATTVQAAVIRRPIFQSNRSGCPNGSCRPRRQPPQEAQPEQVEPPKFDMPAPEATPVEPAAGVVPMPAALGGLVVLALASGTAGAYRQYKATKK